jgi:two-component system sensor histidine kinase TctE
MNATPAEPVPVSVSVQASRWRWPLPRSLQLRLVVWLLLPLLLLLGLGAWLTYRRALEASNAAFDRVLFSSAKSMQEGLRIRDGQVDVSIPYASLEMFESNNMGRVFYRVAHEDGRHITGYEELPLPKRLPPQPWRPRYYDTTYRGEPVRAVALKVSLHDTSGGNAQWVWVLVAETREARQELADDILLGALRQEGLLLLAALCIFALAFRAVLAPIRHISQQVAERHEGDLAPLGHQAMPTELLPLVDALNQYTQRMQQMLQARRRFFDDAAHQLKTPLAVMQAQAELALREADVQEIHRQLQALLKTVAGAGEAVQRLMSLARLEPDNGRQYALRDVDLGGLVKEVALDWATIARRHGVDIEFDAPHEPVHCEAEPTLLQELVANLIDNAIRHGGRRCRVSVGRQLDGTPWLRVEDNGHGIPSAERDRVFKRFYRVPGTQAEGSGLGLSIVREIARVNDAQVDLSEPAGGGLAVQVTLRRSTMGRPAAPWTAP